MKSLIAALAAVSLAGWCAGAQPAERQGAAECTGDRAAPRVPKRDAIVILQAEPPTFDEARIGEAVRAALGLKSAPAWVPLPGDEGATARMFPHEGELYVVRVSDGPWPERAWAPAIAEQVDSAPARAALAEHKGWASVERADAGKDEPMGDAQWRVVARVAAAMLDDRGRLLVRWVTDGAVQLALVTPRTPERLRGGAWQDAFAGDALVVGPGGSAAFGGGDPEMRAAERKARAALGEFRAAWAARTPAQSFAVKARFAEGGDEEHMWVGVSSMGEGVFAGTLLNEPFGLKGVKRGDEVTVKDADVGDWVVAEPEKALRGGFTLRLIEQRSKKGR